MSITESQWSSFDLFRGLCVKGLSALFYLFQLMYLVKETKVNFSCGCYAKLYLLPINSVQIAEFSWVYFEYYFAHYFRPEYSRMTTERNNILDWIYFDWTITYLCEQQKLSKVQSTSNVSYVDYITVLAKIIL